MIGTILFIFMLHVLGFFIAFRYKSDHFTDVIYALSFIIVAWSLIIQLEDPHWEQIWFSVLVTFWGARLAVFLGYRIRIWGQDRRFDEFRKHWKSLILFWFLQFISIMLISVLLFVYLSKSIHPEAKLTIWIGSLVTLSGLLIESIADIQKFQFKQKNPEEFMHIGLWKYSRHPNYFGEFLVWLGLLIYCVQSLNSWEWISIISPLWVFLLVRYISGARLLEESAQQKYGHLKTFQTYRNKTPIFFPGFKLT